MAITRLGSGGYGVRRGGSFAGKAGLTHPVARLTRLSSGGYGSRLTGSFAGKTPDVIVVVPDVVPPIQDFGGGFVAHRPVRYSRPGASYMVPVIEHDEADEEAIIIAILTRVAELEYYQ